MGNVATSLIHITHLIDALSKAKLIDEAETSAHSIVYHDGLWFHHSCWRAGVEQLRNATRLAAVSVPSSAS
jgi:hypothetical protein